MKIIYCWSSCQSGMEKRGINIKMIAIRSLDAEAKNAMRFCAGQLQRYLGFWSTFAKAMVDLRFFRAFGDNTDHNTTDISRIGTLDGAGTTDSKIVEWARSPPIPTEPNQRLHTNSACVVLLNLSLGNSMNEKESLGENRCRPIYLSAFTKVPEERRKHKSRSLPILYA